MRLLVSRYNVRVGLLSRNTVWPSFARPKPAQASSTSFYNKGRLQVIQTRTLAHVVPPPAQPFPPSFHSDGQKAGLGQLLVLSSYFKDLFYRSPPDLREQLLSSIKQNTGVLCAAAVTTALYAVDSLDAPIRAIVEIFPQTGDMVLENDTCLDDSVNQPGPFRDRVKAFAITLLRTDLHYFIYQPERATDTIPSRVLVGALFSASAIKNGLLEDEPFIYAFTRYGLQLPASQPFEGETKVGAAIAALGACLQLITAGSVFMERHFAKTNSLADIVAALEALKVKSSVDYPWGLKLIEKTIEVARANFANPISPSDAWSGLVVQGSAVDQQALGWLMKEE